MEASMTMSRRAWLAGGAAFTVGVASSAVAAAQAVAPAGVASPVARAAGRPAVTVYKSPT
jgi:hypothetical protein